ncbi:mitotic checkpoint protein BUB3-like [Paramacrobiotus metropolitanus]|uniref:mitotic checkpoint protein BUB3-like n=1 Tax=Paramacrobiotus metropolitanus TaxID=2943436 RepID=UPI00244631CD|nr:mitotic checkpoint protein BUB3-like [Paramacrobiotus metropolitanus]
MTALPDKNEINLDEPPSDTISSVRFCPSASNGRLLMVGSWDCTVRVYDTELNRKRHQFDVGEPVLDCCFSDATHAFCGGLENNIKMCDLNSGKHFAVGTHDDSVRCVHLNLSRNIMTTGSWDKTVKTWDPRSKSVTVLQQPDKVYALTSVKDMLVVGTKERKINIWDLRNTAEPIQKRESSLKYQIRSMAGLTIDECFAVASIEGRVAVEYVETDPESQKKKYAFKCHRAKEGNMEMIYPVNALAVHPVHGTMASGGSDGVVNVWDVAHKKRMSQFRRQQTSITSLDFSKDGKVLAMAVSYLFEREDQPTKPCVDHVVIRSVAESEVRPK